MHTRFVALLMFALQQAPVPVQVLQLYVGTYQISPDMKLNVVLDGDHLVGRLGAQAFPLTTVSETRFRVDGPNVGLEFVKDENGAVLHVVLSQNGQRQTAPRMPERHPITPAADVLRRYAGRYTLRPGFDFLITIESTKLMIESVGQFKYPAIAESETRFFFENLDAEIEFGKDANGRSDHLVLHRGTVEETALRLEGS